MNYRTLGKNGPDVSTIAMGCWTIAGGAMWGDVDAKEAIAAIHAAIDAGVTLFDTAEAYGDGASEEILGEAIRTAGGAGPNGNVRSRLVIASKVGSAHHRAADVVAACEGTLRRLKTDYIDLYQQHWPDHRPGEDGVAVEETLQALLRLREQGKIRHIGVCNFGSPNLQEIPSSVSVVSNQLPYSAIWRAIEFEIIPASVERGMGVLAYSSLMHGLLAGRWATADDVPASRARTRHFAGTRPQARHSEPGRERETFEAIRAIRELARQENLPMADLSLAWVLAQPGITSVLAGARTPDQIVENARAGELKLSSEILRRMDQATRNLKLAFGRNPDMWDSTGRTAF